MTCIADQDLIWIHQRQRTDKAFESKCWHSNYKALKNCPQKGKTLEIHWCSLLRATGISRSLAVLHERRNFFLFWASKEPGLYPDAETDNTGYNCTSNCGTEYNYTNSIVNILSVLYVSTYLCRSQQYPAHRVVCWRLDPFRIFPPVPLT